MSETGQDTFRVLTVLGQETGKNRFTRRDLFDDRQF
jgi:hypothetical protein